VHIIAPMSSFLRLQTVMVYVRDQDRSLRFYVNQLGFNLIADSRLPDGTRWVAVGPSDGPAMLALVAPEAGSEDHKLIGRKTHVIFLAEDVHFKFVEWTRQGIRFREIPQRPTWGGVFATFEDLDGNSFAIVGFDAATREIEAARRLAAAKLEADHRAAQELEIAKQVQARLFPQSAPPAGALDYDGICIQARQVGGDYYDFLSLGPERIGLVIGDIAGKGIAGALLMANLQANLRSQCANASQDPLALLPSVNQLFYENTGDSAYATLFFVEYCARGQRLRYANCGHPPALLLRGNGTLERLHSTGTVLGLFKEWDCITEEVSFLPGDLLVLHTDGVSEACDDAGEEFGEKRLAEGLLRHRELRSRALLTALIKEVRRFAPNEQQDDLTLIAAKLGTSKN
jgi:serine phosphatase RsbU (regulator of sigma subunit)/catechol 2,3-dioxygenase-like lactoylglutathione lyase family enzyme